MQIASSQDLSLINKLIDQGLVEKKTLLALLESQKQAYHALEARLQGILVQVDPQAQEFSVRDQVSGQMLLQQPLLISRQRPADWEKWGSHLALVDAEGSQVQSWLDWDLQAPYGLVLSPEGIYHADARGSKSEFLGVSPGHLYGGVCRSALDSGPYDLVFAPDQSLLALSNRGEGSLEIFTLPAFTPRFKVKLRASGGSSALNLAFDLARRRLLVTDQSSSMLSLIDLTRGELSQQKLGLGVLGNLVLAPDGEHVYLLITKPAQELVYLRLADWKVVRTISLKGDLFSLQGRDPCDLLALSADQQHLLVMTYLHAPTPFTPLLSVIDTQQVKTVRRFALKDGRKPCQLLFARNNPLAAFGQQGVREMILAAGLVDRQTLEAMACEAQSGGSVSPPMPSSMPAPAPVPPEPAEFYPPPVYVLPTPPLAPAEKPAPPRPEPPPPKPEPVLKPAVKAKSEPFAAVDLDPEAAEILLELLCEAFLLQTGIDAQERPAVRARLEQEVQRVRPLLGRQDAVPVELEQVAEGRGLKTTLRRRQLGLRQELRAWLRGQEPVVVPLDCPQCRQKLMGHWDCQVCGLELENPQRAFARRVASADPAAELTPGHFLLPDPDGLRLLELDARKQVCWLLDPDQLSCEYPVDAVRLPKEEQERLLVADSQTSQVYELGLKGKLYWQFQTGQSPEHRLSGPVRVSYYRPQADGPLHYLIVDQRHHRVLEIDRQHRIHWQFGIQGEAGPDHEHLNYPSDLQYTPERTFLICDAGNARVLEVDPVTGKIERRFDQAGYGLSRPVLARRLANGKTLIVDAGSFQLLELSPLGTISERISFYKPEMPEEIKLQSPTGLVRLPNQDLILYNGQKALHLQPLQKKLIWIAAIRDLRPGRPGMLTEPAASTPAEPDPLAEAAPAVQAKTPQAKKLTARVVEAKEAAKTQPLTGKDRVQALINKRPVVSNKESFEHSVVFTRPDTELLPLSVYLLDWRHNAVLRINRKGKLTWHFGFEMGQELARPVFVQEYRHSLLITDTDHHRVLEVAKADKDILHIYGGVAGKPLSHPRSALRLENGHVLIADQRHKRLVELSAEGEVVWEFRDEELIASPQYVEVLPDGDLLFCDSLLNRVLQIDRQGQIQWYYGAPPPGKHFGKADKLFGPSFATRLPDGRTLIADTRHHRVLEVTPLGEVVWEYVGQARSSRINPTHARRLENGNTLITYLHQSKIIELNPQNQCVWSYTIGKDVFVAPVDGDEEHVVQHDTDKPTSFYNAVEKRMLQSARQDGQEATELYIELMDHVQMKSTRAQVIMYEVEKHGMVFKSFPPPEDLLAGRFGKHLIITCLLDGNLSSAALGGRVANIAEVQRVDVCEPKLT